MTPAKKKSIELIELFSGSGPMVTRTLYSKQNAQLCATEILNEYQELKELDMKSTKWDSLIKFWVDVIEEIQKT